MGKEKEKGLATARTSTWEVGELQREEIAAQAAGTAEEEQHEGEIHSRRLLSRKGAESKRVMEQGTSVR
jgi:hypothetical protein